jgi:hypothetical protein
MIEHVVQGLRVYVWPSALNADEVAELERRSACLPANEYTLKDGGAIARALGSFVKPHMVSAPPFRWADAIIRIEQRTPIGWHFDRDYAAPWRVLVYFSSLGGTEFDSGLIAGGNPGDVVMFDTRLRHRSQVLITNPKQPKQAKIILGLRALHETDEAA